MRMTTSEELLRSPPATHHIRSWSGIIDPKDSSNITKNTVWAQLSQSEPHEPHFRVFQNFGGRQLFLDIGANCGQSIISLKAVNPDAQIKSFEPTSFSFQIAERVGKIFPDTEVYNFGLSDHDARLPIFTPVIDGLLVTPLTSLDPSAFEQGGMMHKFLVEDIAKGAEISLFAQEIELRRGDNLALAPDVMKIDVEGAELKVLAGMRETISMHGPLIMTEKSDAVSIARFLAECDYEPYRLDEELILKRMPIVEGVDPNFLPLNIFYLNQDKLDLYRNEFGVRIERSIKN